MKKFIFTFFIFLSLINIGKADTIDCFIVKNDEKILIQEGKNCNIPYSPNSSFKIPLAIIGFESGILKGRHNPIWKPQKAVTFLKYYHDGEQSPSSWMRFSMPWYSQVLTQKLGMRKFQTYVNKLNYGNKNLSGDTDKNNGLTDSWLASSLLISPLQQLEFIDKLAKNELPFSKESQEKTKDLMKLMEESSNANWWSMHGKTGSSGFDKRGRKEGYFVGFAQKNGKTISFVIHMSGEIGDKNSKASGMYSKRVAMERMMKEAIIN